MSVIIRLQGLPLSASSADIRNFFCGLRIPDGGVNIVGGEEGDAFIRFTTDEDARQAMRKNNGLIHNYEVCLSLSSIVEMKEIIDRASSARSANVSSRPSMYDIVVTPRFETNMPRQLPSSEDPSRFGRDFPRYGMNGEQLDRDSSFRDREEPIPMTGRSLLEEQSRLDDSKGIDEGYKAKPSMSRPLFEMHEKSEIANMKKSSNESTTSEQTAQWMNRGCDFMVNTAHQTYPLPDGCMESAIRHGDRHLSTRDGKADARDRGRIGADGDDNNGRRNTEESWRHQNIRSFERMPLLNSNGSTAQKEEEVSFFGRGPSLPKRPLLPPPSLQISSVPPHSSSHPSPMQIQKEEEFFVELTRLPFDLLRPSLLENFIAPSIPLKLSSVKVVYSPEGIHMQSLVRFTSAMDAFNALKKDGEQGVKIRPSTREAFESARDGPPPSLSHIRPPVLPLFTPFPIFPPIVPVVGSGIGRLPQLMDQNGMMMGNDRRGRGRMDEGREERRREDTSQRGRREERGRRSNSPRSKKARVDRVCVQVSNLPFRTKEPEIRRMLGPGLNPFCIKKIFNVDNAPSDVWIMEFGSEAEANEMVQRRMELGGREARLRRMSEEEADRLLRQKFISPPRRGEKEGERSLDEKVRKQQEAIELEGAFTAPVFTTTRGFMRGRGGRGTMTGGRGGRGGRSIIPPLPNGGNGRNCLLVSNMPPLPTPAMLLEHLRVNPVHIMRVDQIAPDAAIIELRGEREALEVAANASGHQFPPLNGRRLLVAALGRRQIEEEFNLRTREMMERGSVVPPSMVDSQQGERSK